MKKSAISRSIEFAKMAARIGLKELTSGDFNSRIEQAKIIADGLSQLKGAAMKAGQLLSIEIGDYFPKEAQEVLSILQNAATPVRFEEIKRILELELTAKVFAEFENLSEKSVASASIGQVHRAKYKGQDIAIKVQYQGVAESIDSDLALLKKIAVAFCSLTGREMDMTPLFNEFREVLSNEVNYLNEAEMQTAYKINVDGINGKSGFNYFVPKVLEGLTTERVLVMDWQDGVSLKTWMFQAHTKKQREHLAHSLLNLYCFEFFEWGLVQTDPNFANYLVRDSSNLPELVLLDFGATRVYERSFINNYVDLLKASVGGDNQRLVAEAIRFELIDERESSDALQAFVELMKVAIAPFFSENDLGVKKQTTFQFANENYARLSRDSIRKLSAKLKFSPPPYKLIFLHRKLGGLFAILKNLEVEIDVSSYWQRMVGQ